ncbi:GSCOCG00009779001-RA-CDS [Cotesia congregata]|nr:GSCOCG00009779001-RA-CDS [Cotesia congregata]
MSELTRNSSTDDPKLELLNNSMAKSLFDSLNLQFDDGKPKFRLNEPSYSTVNIPYQNNLNCDDDDDETSFVVLGKSSMDFVNLTSLADYEEIKKKSLNVEPSSIVSTLSQEEIELKVGKLMKENVELKETLTRNNDSMKKHFNTLVSWQNELMKVHGSHKQKFSETCDMISLLKKENAELKNKLTATESMLTSIHINSIEFSLLNDFSTESLAKSFEAISLLQKEHSELKMKISDLESSMTSSLTLEQAGNSINQEKKNLSIENQNHCSNSHITDSANQNSKDFSLKELPKENSTDLEQMAKNKDRYERDMHYQQEIITSLKEQLRLLNENAFISLQLNPENNAIPEKSQDENYKKFFQHFNHYNEKLSILAKCYGEQTSHFINIQDYLKRCTDTCELLLDNIDSMNLSVETIGSCKEILENCRRSLVDEQIKNISYRQNLIKAQNEFQIIFSDYNSTLHELEILRDENMKPAEVKYNFEKEKNEITRNLKMLEDEKNQLSLERKNYMAERMILEQEKTNLSEEKSSINFQSMLYEAQMRTLQDDMKVLQKRHDEMLLENTKLKEELKMKNIEVEGVKARFEISKDDIDMIGHLRQQLELYESDFEEEKRTKQELIREREHLTDQLGKLRDHNQNLLQRLNGPNPAAVPQHSANGIPVDAFCDTCGLYKMPGQWHGPGWCQAID